MMRKLVSGVCLSAMGALCLSAVLSAAAEAPVAEAAMAGDKATVRTLLKQGMDVNAAQGDGMTALHWAVYKDDLEMARMLIQAGADLKVKTRVGAITPLLMAATHGNA
ncbi:MAG: ankyrin repeat domain-containing protein, partial [Vicinamibacterales bacterium]